MKKKMKLIPMESLSLRRRDVLHVMDNVVGHGVKLGRQVQFIKDSAQFPNCKWSSISSLFTAHCYANEVSRHTNPSRQENPHLPIILQNGKS